MSHPPLAIEVLVLLTVVLAAIFDVWQRRVPNWITLSAIPLAIALNAFLDLPSANWKTSAEGLGVAFLIYFPLYLLRGMGAGDVKLMGAIGAAVGPWNWLGVLFLTAIFGGLTAIAVVATRGRVRRTFRNVWFIILSLLHRQPPYEGNPELDIKNVQAVRLPHAVAIATGCVAFLIAAAIWAPK